MPKRIVITEEPSAGEAIGSFLLILVGTLGIGIFILIWAYASLFYRFSA